MITFRIDIEPKGWARPTPWMGRIITPAVQRAYQGRLKAEAKLALGSKPKLRGPVHVHVTAFMPIPKSWSAGKQGLALCDTLKPVVKPDADNILKNALDAFNGTLWDDDAQVTEATVVKKYSSSPALVIVARAA